MNIRCKVNLHILTVCQGQLSDYLYFHLFYFLNYRWKFQLARSMYWSRRVVQSMDLTWDDLSSFFLQRGNLCSCRCCSFNECMGKFTILEWYVTEGTDSELFFQERIGVWFWLKDCKFKLSESTLLGYILTRFQAVKPPSPLIPVIVKCYPVCFECMKRIVSTCISHNYLFSNLNLWCSMLCRMGLS